MTRTRRIWPNGGRGGSPSGSTTGRGAAGRELTNWLVGQGVALLVLAVLGVLPLLPTVKIITVFETVHSGLEWGQGLPLDRRDRVRRRRRPHAAV